MLASLPAFPWCVFPWCVCCIQDHDSKGDRRPENAPCSALNLVWRYWDCLFRSRTEFFHSSALLFSDRPSQPQVSFLVFLFSLVYGHLLPHLCCISFYRAAHTHAWMCVYSLAARSTLFLFEQVCTYTQNKIFSIVPSFSDVLTNGLKRLYWAATVCKYKVIGLPL